MSEHADPRLVQSLEDADLSYTSSNGDLLVTLDWGKDKELISLENGTYEWQGIELRRVRSTGYSGEYPSPKLLAYCLEYNQTGASGAWEAVFDREKKTCELVFCIKVGATLEGKLMRKIALTCAAASLHLKELIAEEAAIELDFDA